MKAVVKAVYDMPDQGICGEVWVKTSETSRS